MTFEYRSAVPAMLIIVPVEGKPIFHPMAESMADCERLCRDIESRPAGFLVGLADDLVDDD